jgi:RNA polymerase sigma factor (sigma-70 family)
MTVPSEHTTQILVGRIRAGDAGARDALIARIDPLLRRFARGRVPQLLRHDQDTADLVQSTWLRVLDKLERVSLQAPGDFFAYLRAVLINALREALRRQGSSPVDPRADADLAGAFVAAANVDLDDWLAYEQALATLAPEHRTLVLMRFEFGMSFAEIAAELGETPDGVRMKVNRAIARIAQAGADKDP